MSRPNPTGHPARFSDEIIELFADILTHEYPEWFGRPLLHDPFAGTGEALEDLARRIDFGYQGTEIEPEFIVAPHIKQGDACDPSTYPPPPYVIITSPAYPNGISDSWQMAEDSKRFTYQQALNRLLGTHRQLHPNNQGRFGYRGTKRGGKSSNRDNYWRIARAAVACWTWADLVLLNVSDFKAKGGTEPLVMDWRQVLAENGWTIQIEHPVATRRIGMGENRDERVSHEVIVVARRREVSGSNYTAGGQS